MRKTLIIAVREYIAAVRTKAFIISIIAMPVLMGGGIIAHTVLEGQVDTTDKRIAVIDRSGAIADALIAGAKARNESAVTDAETGKKIRPAYVIETVAPAEDAKTQELELSDQVRSKQLHAYVVIGADIVEPGEDETDAQVRYHAENAALDDVRNWLAQVINEHVRSLRLNKAQLDPEIVAQVTKPTPVEALGLVSRDEATGEVTDAKKSSEAAAIIVPMAIMMLMFMMITLGATPLINSVIEEKMQRIAEVMLGSATPFQMMLGKLIGSVGVSLTVVAVYIIGGSFAATRVGAGDLVPYSVLPWMFAFLIGAILMFGSMFVAIGAACNDLKEAQSLMMPVWILVCIPMFVWIQVVREPMSSFSVGISFVPFCTPMLMLMRMTTPATIPAWQPWVGLAGVLVTTVILVWSAGRIFRIGILMSGKPPKLSELAKWALRG